MWSSYDIGMLVNLIIGVCWLLQNSSTTCKHLYILSRVMTVSPISCKVMPVGLQASLAGCKPDLYSCDAQTAQDAHLAAKQVCHCIMA